MLILILFYVVNERKSKRLKYLFTLLGLFCFFIANSIMLFKTGITILYVGSLFFIIGKIFYACRFSNNSDFDLSFVFPLVGIYLIYMFIILNLTMENMGDFLIPILIFLFVTLLAFQFALLRKKAVNKQSYLLVIIGMLLFLIADTSSVLSSFYHHFTNQDIFTMFFYGVAQYLIVLGLLRENNNLKI
ncbi:lysoplasmalogenase family protein [Psychroserpens sp. Hel_I_66]|uniref:lysoplasmalogenase family protein n=1 Tax=Psychroserpens sp. Hel_I_66 TaxID=1250004 RepID=UPI000A52169F|nr:lysoplasmalogenase family protein [Psychroserpens sp. Hel_I_66]